MSVYLTTTTTVTIRDLGNRIFEHPTIKYNLYSEFKPEEIRDSLDIQTYITDGSVIIQDANDNIITNPSVGLATVTTYDSINNSQVKTTPIDNDMIGIIDSVSSDLKKISWSNIKTSLSTVGITGPTGPQGYAQDTLVFPVDINRFGFLNRTQTKLSFDGVSQLSLGDTGSGWSYYRSGLKHTISGTHSVVLATPMVDGQKYFIYIDSTDGELISDTNIWTFDSTKVMVASLFWNSTLTPKYVLSDERHTCVIDRAMHKYEHLSSGTQYLGGGVPTGYTASSTVASHKAFGISEASIADEDLFFTLPQLSKPDGATNTYYNFYRTSASNWVWSFSDMPFKYSGTASPYGYIEYDNGSGITTAAGANRFVNTYLVLSNIVNNSEVDPNITTSPFRFVMVQGRGAYTTAALAIGENFGSFNLTGFPANEAVAIYQITWQTSNYANTIKGRCALTSIQPISSNIITTTSTAIGEHNTLAGLQGGSIGEYYHLTSDLYNLISTGIFGATGSTGATGPQGIQGIEGPTGPSGTASTDDFINARNLFYYNNFQ